MCDGCAPACSLCGNPFPCNCQPIMPSVPCPDPEQCGEIYPLGCVEYQGTSDILCSSGSTLYPAVTHNVVLAADPIANRRLPAILGNINSQLCYLFSKDFLAQALSIINQDQQLSALFCQITCNCQCGNKCNMPTNLSVSMQADTGNFAKAVLNWIPGGGPNATSQLVKYKLHSASTWTTATNTGSATTATYTITGLTANVTYDFLIENICTNEALTDSLPVQGIYLTCPTPQFTVSGQNITVSFIAVSADITSYDIDLVNSSGSTIDTYHINPPFTSPISHVFASEPAGTYSVIIHQHVQTNALAVLKDCVYTNVATSQATCPTISSAGITAVLTAT